MGKKAEEQKYEEAANIRDKIQAIENISQKQKVSNISENSIDVIGMARNEISVCVEVFFVRGSKMIGREHFFLNDLKDMEAKEILSGFIKEYYIGNENIPSKIMIEEEIEEEVILSRMLSDECKRKVEIKSPKKGEKLRFVEMAKNNAKVTLENKMEDKYEILSELKDKLGLEKIPKKIETFDISNISGTNIVARNGCYSRSEKLTNHYLVGLR
ncbi:MAG: UvrB/UvrC motif-containing protein [Clostridia bacterium]|nr:UvrB/UvrC motif-containing protein [Clostridia bacterium]